MQVTKMWPLPEVITVVLGSAVTFRQPSGKHTHVHTHTYSQGAEICVEPAGHEEKVRVYGSIF